ncbi:hypothetical protein [Capnocytophaga gingivalis]
MTLSYISEKHKIAFADAFEAMACSIPSTSKEAVLEEKEFDQKGRLIERHLIYYEKKSMLEIYNYNLPLAKECYDEEEISKENENRTPLMDEHYDYEKGVVHKSFYECGSKILQITFPLYSEQELRAKHMPIKEWVQRLGFTPEQVTEINLNIKSTDKIGGIQQETIHGCEGYFKKAYRTAIIKSAYDEKGNIYAIEEYVSSWGEQRIEYRTFDAQNNLIFQGHSWEEDTLGSIEVSLYDKQNRVIQRIDIGGNGSITHYTYKKNEVICNEIGPLAYKISHKIIEKIGNNTCETIRTEGSSENNETISILDPKGRLLKKTEIDYENEKKACEREEEYTYNESGVFIKKMESYVCHNPFLCASSYGSETILYNGQGQKIEHSKKNVRERDLISLDPIIIKDQIILEKSLYYYNEQGDLIREELKKWRADEGIETDVELLTTQHFYEREEEYETHLKVTVKNNL